MKVDGVQGTAVPVRRFVAHGARAGIEDNRQGGSVSGKHRFRVGSVEARVFRLSRMPG